jgi:hypothetical protein
LKRLLLTTAIVAALFLTALPFSVAQSPAPKRYVASLTQSGTDDPVATVFVNDFGGDLTWSRYAGGAYTVNREGAFPAGRLTMKVSKATLATITSDALMYRSDDDTITLETQVDEVSSDGVLSATSIEIVVYPN